MSPLQFSCGLDYPVGRELGECLREAGLSKYHFITVPIVHPRLRRKWGAGGGGAFTRSDMLLEPCDWNYRVVGRVSPHLQVDVEAGGCRQLHEDLLTEEFAHCRNLGVSTVVVRLTQPNNINLARILNHHLNSSSPIWVEVPMEDPKKRAYKQTVDSLSEPVETDEVDTWGWWSALHAQTEWNRKMGLCVRVPAELPDQSDLDRWLGEPIKCVILPTSVFITNKKGFPVLSRAHQHFIRDIMMREVHFLITGVVRHAEKGHYFQYLEYLWNQRELSTKDPVTAFAKGWEDYLQTPLQPLSDNLDAHTYDVFEKDNVKYDVYQAATVSALQDRYSTPPQCQGASTLDRDTKAKESSVTVLENGDVMRNLNGIELEPEPDGPSEVICPLPQDDAGSCGCQHSAVVMVLGAGRGPLVRAALNAGIIAKVNLKVYAVEKNPCALQSLYAQQREIWKESVTVVASDMRDFHPPQLADIIISELLGSFGDNELSPECLDGARHLLKPDGISIPRSYTSYIAPVMSARLWGHIKEWGDYPQISSIVPGMGSRNLKPAQFNFETLWVVYLQNRFNIADPKALFTFTHPNTSPQPENRRWARLTFEASRSCVLHGFSGYFDCLLYGEHKLSILPAEHTKNMISWFPVFCPIKNPMRIKAGDKISVDFWRCSLQNKSVWYEWCVTLPELQSIHNLAGRSSNMIL